MSAGAWGAAVGAVWGAYTKWNEINATNDALVGEAEFNLSQYNMKKMLTEFAQSNNNERAFEISKQVEAEGAEASRQAGVAKNQAVSQVVNARSATVTAGNSVLRQVNDVMRKGAEVQAGITSKTDTAIKDTMDQARQTNAQEQAGLINAYHETVYKNAMLAAQEVYGLDAWMSIAGQAMQGAQSGYSMGSSFGSMFQIGKGK